MEKTVEIAGELYILREIKYVDLTEINAENKKESAIKILKLGTTLTDEAIMNLPARIGTKLLNEVNKFNGFGENF